MIEVFHQRRLEQAAEAASFLYQAGARNVWLFGSIARGEVRDKRSDLDLAVEGLDENQARQLKTALRARLRCKVDVACMDRTFPQLREGILKCRVFVSREACRTGEALGRALPQQRTYSVFPQSLQETRMQAIVSALRMHGARSVLDLGCGSGMLLERLAAEPWIEGVLGVDISMAALKAAGRRVGLSSTTAPQGRISLLQALATNPDPRFRGFSAVTAIELIEHLDPARLVSFGRVIFSYLRPPLVVITTPNFEYNVRWHVEPKLRRKDHRFEWTREQFERWVLGTAAPSGYLSCIQEIGTKWRSVGAPTQMAILSRSVTSSGE